MLKVFEVVGSDGRAGLQADLEDFIRRFNESDDETVVMPADYLDVVATRRWPMPDDSGSERSSRGTNRD